MTLPIAFEETPVSIREGEAALRLEGISVRYRIRSDPHMSLKESVLRRHGRRFVEHLALDRATLTIARGQTLGVIGRNGSGKTTLLNVMARVLQPTSGRLRIRGTVAPLIDLLAGFHPDLTGRENAILRGAFLGIRRRVMLERMDRIAGFAAIGNFFDAPLRTYSAGMIVRLAFAVATSVDADILLIDEALGVGDAEFQARCAARIDEFHARGVTFVVVSHDVQRLVSMCDRILWLEGGRARAIGTPRDVVAQYAASLRHP
ncbi:MAG TPA: ABC transporter ATP-binding protein [Thermoanaerobaculia bacterium]